MIPSGDLAYGAVPLHLGLELLSHLDGDQAQALKLFDHAKQLAGLADSSGIGGMSEAAAAMVESSTKARP